MRLHVGAAAALVMNVFTSHIVDGAVYPEELLSQIRFYHLQESFYDNDNEKVQHQAERYLAEDLVQSIEEACFAVGVTPKSAFEAYTIAQRLRNRYVYLSIDQARFSALQRAYDTFVRQRHLEASALLLNDLEEQWQEWWNGIAGHVL